MATSEIRSFNLLEVLQKSMEKFAKRSDVRLSQDPQVNVAATGTGGLLSTVQRVKASYVFDGDETIHSKNFIFKRLPNTELQLDLVRDRGIFEKEALFYGRVLPMIEQLPSTELGIPLPKCHYVKCDGINDVIVMDDLSEEGYRTPGRLSPAGLDLPHSTLAMRCLGRLHGLGVAVEKSLPPESGGWLEAFPAFGKESWFYEAGKDEIESPAVSLTESALKTILKISKEIDVLPMEAEASGLLEKAGQEIWRTCCRFVEPVRDGVNVPCHGDYYVNNLMFKYADDGSGGEKPVGVKVIDLQLTRYCHPATDILFFMYLCTTKSMRDAHLEELLAVYHGSLVETLNGVGRGPPPITLEELSRDVLVKCKPFGVINAAVSVPNLLLVNEFAPVSFEELFKTGYVSTVVMEQFAVNSSFRLRMVELIKEFVEVAFPNGPNTLEASPLIA